jgi:hypothetical protein
MNTRKVSIWAGGFGLAACLLTFIEFPLWMIGGAEPSFLDSQAFSEFVARTKTLYLHRTLLDMFIFSFLLVFMAGFRQIIIQKDHDYEWMATLFFGIGLVYITLTLVADSITGAVGLDTVAGNPNPTIILGLTEATILMYGSVALMLLGMMLSLATYLLFKTEAMPKWVGWITGLVALLNFAFVPTMYFGTDPTKFYSAAGLGPSVGATFPFLIWIAIVSVLMIRKKESK